MRARRICGSRCTNRRGSRGSAITAASFSAIASRRSACARTITPPSEVIRPPSNAAVIFLLATAGKANGRNLSLVMAGVVRYDRVNRMALAPNSYARPIRYATPANIQKSLRYEKDGLALGCQFRWTRQLPPAARRLEHNLSALSRVLVPMRTRYHEALFPR